MIDNINFYFNYLNKTNYRLQRKENEIHRENPKDVNQIIWRVFGNDFCISGGCVKYLQYQHLNLPRPTKS